MKTTRFGLIQIFIYWVYLLVVWGVFRLLFRLGDVSEELIIKPLVWGWPVIGWQLWGKNRVNLFSGNILKAVVGGTLLGLGFAVVLFLANWLKAGVLFGQISLPHLSSSEVVTLGLATAIVEESVFSGFVLLKIKQMLKNETISIGLTTLIYVSLHIPIALFVYTYSGWNLMGFLAIVSLVAVSKYWLMMRLQNIWAPIMAHWIWGVMVWTIG